MAWRIDEQVIRGELDNRKPGRVTGRIWLLDRDEPIALDLRGNPWRDLAGQRIRFTHSQPGPGRLDGLATSQLGLVGDITASRKIKVPEIPLDEMPDRAKAGAPYPWHWSNSIYLEWFSQRNGRIVIESTNYQIEIDSDPAWTMDEVGEIAQRVENARALTEFMNRLGATAAGGADDDDAPQSEAEAKADAEASYMDALLDRIQARIDRENQGGHIDFGRIHREEHDRLRREMDIPREPGPPPEEEP